MKPGVILFLKELSVLVSSNAGLANHETFEKLTSKPWVVKVRKALGKLQNVWHVMICWFHWWLLTQDSEVHTSECFQIISVSTLHVSLHVYQRRQGIHELIPLPPLASSDHLKNLHKSPADFSQVTFVVDCHSMPQQGPHLRSRAEKRTRQLSSQNWFKGKSTGKL